MQKAKKDSKKKSLLKWILLGVAVILLGVGGYFGYKYYQDYQANKVYSVGETVGLSDFKVDITKAEFKSVDLPIDKDSVAKYGALDKHEDCEKQSKENTWWRAWDNDPNAPWSQTGPSDFNICVRRNNSRDIINEYAKNNSQLVVDYKITAINNVDTSKLKIELIPDSGRKLGEQVESFNANQFFPNGAQRKITVPRVAGQVYTSDSYYDNGKINTFTEPYEPYHTSNVGNDINKGLERTGYIYTDIRNTESNVDIKITYNGETRLVRITR